MVAGKEGAGGGVNLNVKTIHDLELPHGWLER